MQRKHFDKGQLMSMIPIGTVLNSTCPFCSEAGLDVEALIIATDMYRLRCPNCTSTIRVCPRTLLKMYVYSQNLRTKLGRKD